MEKVSKTDIKNELAYVLGEKIIPFWLKKQCGQRIWRIFNIV